MLFSVYCNVFLHLSIPWIDIFIHSAPSFEKWIHRYSSGKSSTFIPLGYDAARWTPQRREQRSKLSFEHDGILQLVYVGTLSHQIDLSPLLAAISGLNRIHMTIIGDGEDMQKLRRMVRETNMGNVTFTGYIPYEAVAMELSTKHIGINPQIASSIPNKFFDYLAAGLPILVLGQNDAAEFVRYNNIGWGAEFESENIRKILLELNEKDIEEKYVSVTRIRDKYSKERLYIEYIRILINGVGCISERCKNAEVL
jgi:glycosyltransferase involved in cell wall biosynthesis